MEADEAVEEGERVATLVPGTIAAITTAVEVEAEAVDTTTIVAAAAAMAVAMVAVTTVVTIVEGVVVMQGVRTIVHGNCAMPCVL